MARYKKGENPEYDKAYAREKTGSQILNPGRAGGSQMDLVNLHDLKGIQTALWRWRDGKHGEEPHNFLNQAEAQVNEVKRRFEAYKARMINEGKRAPSEMPAELQEELMKAEARLEVVKEEIKELERLEKEFKERERETSEKKILARGPSGWSVIKNGQICEIDGQPVKKSDSGMFVIDCPKSPYHQMIVADYLEKIVKVWLRENAKLQREHREKVAAGEFRLCDRPLPSAPWPEPA